MKMKLIHSFVHRARPCALWGLFTLCIQYPSVFAAEIAGRGLHDPCFAHSELIKTPLQAPAFTEESKALGRLDEYRSGKSKTDLTWAMVRGKVNRPLSELVDLLLDHDTTKSPRIDEMSVDETEPDGYLKQHLVSFLIKPFLFIRVSWKERWTYWVDAPKNSKGMDLKKAKRALIAYEKIEGTNYIDHLCGTFELEQLSPKSTNVYLYEEAKAHGRTPEDTLKGLQGTLKTLRD